MSTYVVAFTINEFVSRKVPTKNGLPIEMWARRDVIDETEFACKITPTILEYFEEMFQQYTGPKIDMVLLTAFPDEATAIESWGKMMGPLTHRIYCSTISTIVLHFTMNRFNNIQGKRDGRCTKQCIISP